MDRLSEEVKCIARTRVRTREEREEEKMKEAESFALKMAVGFLVFQASMALTWTSQWSKRRCEVGWTVLALSVSNIAFHCFSGWSTYRSVAASNPRAMANLSFRTAVAVVTALVASLVAFCNVLGLVLFGF